MALDGDRVRRHTARSVLRCIDDDTTSRLTACANAPPEAIEARLHELDREWDTDRAIETEASLMGLLGLAAGALVHPRALGLSGFVAGAVFVHAVTGWYPLLPLLRRLGFRSAREIARERHALKALRGDFAGLAQEPGAGRAGDMRIAGAVATDDWGNRPSVPGAGAH
jgi:hypothetical protein